MDQYKHHYILVLQTLHINYEQVMFTQKAHKCSSGLYEVLNCILFKVAFVRGLNFLHFPLLRHTFILSFKVMHFFQVERTIPYFWCNCFIVTLGTQPFNLFEGTAVAGRDK